MFSKNEIKELLKIEKKHIWHPFTQMADWQKEEPLIIESGEGVYLKDIFGRKYIDGVSSLWVNLHGHKNPYLDKALQKQLKRIAHTTFLGLTHIPAIELTEKLIKLVPDNLTRIFYSDNGSTAVEIALKMAYQYWRQKKSGQRIDDRRPKSKFLSLKNAYHGDTIGSVSVGGIELFHEKFRPLLFDCYFVPSPYCYRCERRLKVKGERLKVKKQNKHFQEHCQAMGCGGGCLGEVEEVLRNHHTEIVAAVVEPMIQAAAGMLTMPPGYMSEFSKLCKKYNVLLIADEVATGFGHTGKMFACEFEDIKPDFLCLAKGITAGYLPLAATLTTEEIYRAFLGRYEEFKTFFHGHTYTANPLACAVAVENLRIFEREKLNLSKKIDTLRGELKTLLESHYVGNIRQLGFMVGIEIVKDKKTKEMFPPSMKVAIKICYNARKYGVILRPLGNVIVILPPLSISEREIKKIVDSIKRSIVDVLG